MAKNVEVIPFTELVERVGQLARERADTRQKVRSVVNDVYIREIVRKEDWTFLLTSSAVTLQQAYNTGTVTATTGGTTATFSSAVSLDSSYTGWKLKISGNDYVYDFTFSGTTSGTINPPLSGDQNSTSQSYNLFQPYYELAEDFERFPKNGGLYNYTGNTRQVIAEYPFQEFLDLYNSTPINTPERCRLYGTSTNNRTILEVNPPPKIAKSLPYDYYRRVPVLQERTDATVTISANGTSVTGNGTTFTQARTGDYLRVDPFGTAGDSEWYRIQVITNDTTMTLATAFGVSGATSASYTISSVPQMPYKMHPAILYGAILQITADQDDPMYQAYNIKYAEVLSDGKRLYKSRVYNQDIHHLGEEYLYRR